MCLLIHEKLTMNGRSSAKQSKTLSIAKYLLALPLLLIASSCGPKNPEAIEKLNELHSRLDIGMNYKEYGDALGDIKVVLDKKADKKAQRSFQAHLYGHEFWGCDINHTSRQGTQQLECYMLVALRFDNDFAGFNVYDHLMASHEDYRGAGVEVYLDALNKEYIRTAWEASQMVLDGEDPGEQALM